jgi:protein-S-isoprenylcysteine O-methyltransferase Ste14
MLSYRAAEFVACVVLLVWPNTWLQAAAASPPLHAVVSAGLAGAAYVVWRLLVGEAWATGRSGAAHRLWCLAAVALCLGGQALRQWSKAALGASFTAQLTEPAALVTDGPYALLLHPGFAGVVASHVGLLMLLCVTSRWRLVVVPALAAAGLAVLLRRIAAEEALLARVFGEAFATYAAAVRWRLLPGVW